MALFKGDDATLLGFVCPNGDAPKECAPNPGAAAGVPDRVGNGALEAGGRVEPKGDEELFAFVGGIANGDVAVLTPKGDCVEGCPCVDPPANGDAALVATGRDDDCMDPKLAGSKASVENGDGLVCSIAGADATPMVEVDRASCKGFGTLYLFASCSKSSRSLPLNFNRVFSTLATLDGACVW